jgi:DNA-binding CsgD family transcriptional regulator
MGAVSIDMHRKGREYGNLYRYKKEGIKTLLKDLNRLNESKIYKGDYDAAAILTDLNISLNNGCLTPRQRQCLGLHYFINLSIDESSTILGIHPRVFKYHLKGVLLRLAENMCFGTLFMKGDPVELYGKTYGIYKWLDDIALGMPLREPPYEAFLDIADILSETDEKSFEMVRQRREGFVYIERDVKEEYPCMHEEQLRWADRRVSYVEEVFPPGDAIGSRKVLVRDEENKDGVEYMVERRKIYKQGGN